MPTRDILLSAAGTSNTPAIDPTTIFSPVAYSGNATARSIVNGLDLNGAGGLVWIKRRDGSSNIHVLVDTVRGITNRLDSAGQGGQVSYTDGVTAVTSTGFSLGTDLTVGAVNATPFTYGSWTFKKAATFFDIVSYTGTGSLRNVAHNLTVAPELMIVKCTSTSTTWAVYHTSLGNTQWVRLDTAFTTATNANAWGNTSPTSTIFTVGTDASVNSSGASYVAYLFASVPGACKIGSYTGVVGASQTINCGFNTGARFVMIKRTDNTGDWYIWDTARGIGAGNDPHVSPNLGAAEVATDDSISTTTSGFTVNQVSATNINISNANYIYLAIA